MKQIALLALIYLAAMSSVAAATPPWTYERDPSLGFQFSYPRDLFDRTEGDGKPSFHYFVSKDADAKLIVGAWNNEAGQTPAEFKRWLEANTAGYEEQTYVPHGRSWFVTSGYRGDDIYYEKVMFSCSGGVVNVMAISYPKSSRHFYDPVVERMEDGFRPRNRC